MGKLSEQNKKIWDYIQNNPFVGKNLFFYNPLKNKFDGGVFDDTSEYGVLEEAFKNTTWLYRLKLDCSYIIAIGIDTTDQSVMTIGDEGDIGIITDDFSNLPYEFLAILCSYLRSYSFSTKEALEEEPEFKQALEMYEVWCKQEGISLDTSYKFHDKNGQLLAKLGDNL